MVPPFLLYETWLVPVVCSVAPLLVMVLVKVSDPDLVGTVLCSTVSYPPVGVWMVEVVYYPP